MRKNASTSVAAMTVAVRGASANSAISPNPSARPIDRDELPFHEHVDRAARDDVVAITNVTGVDDRRPGCDMLDVACPGQRPRSRSEATTQRSAPTSAAGFRRPEHRRSRRHDATSSRGREQQQAEHASEPEECCPHARRHRRRETAPGASRSPFRPRTEPRVLRKTEANASCGAARWDDREHAACDVEDRPADAHQRQQQNVLQRAPRRRREQSSASHNSEERADHDRRQARRATTTGGDRACQ